MRNFVDHASSSMTLSWLFGASNPCVLRVPRWFIAYYPGVLVVMVA
jgi:hypothetical protein